VLRLLRRLFSRSTSTPPASSSAATPAQADRPVLRDAQTFIDWLDAGKPGTLEWWMEQAPGQRELLAHLGATWRRAWHLDLANAIRDPARIAAELAGEEAPPQAPEAARDPREDALQIAETLLERLAAKRAPSSPSSAQPRFEGLHARRQAREQRRAQEFTLGGIPAEPISNEAGQ